jgi:hypothetical protein
MWEFGSNMDGVYFMENKKRNCIFREWARMSVLKPANHIAKRLKDINIPPLVRPHGGPDAAPTEELVLWGMQMP